MHESIWRNGWAGQCCNQAKALGVHQQLHHRPNWQHRRFGCDGRWICPIRHSVHSRVKRMDGRTDGRMHPTGSWSGSLQHRIWHPRRNKIILSSLARRKMASWLHPLSLCQMRRKGKVLRTHHPTTAPSANAQTQALTRALHLDGTVFSSLKSRADWHAQIPTWHMFDKNSTRSHTVIPRLLTIFVTPFFTLRRNEKTRYLFFLLVVPRVNKKSPKTDQNDFGRIWTCANEDCSLNAAPWTTRPRCQLLSWKSWSH